MGRLEQRHCPSRCGWRNAGDTKRPSSFTRTSSSATPPSFTVPQGALPRAGPQPRPSGSRASCCSKEAHQHSHAPEEGLQATNAVAYVGRTLGTGPRANAHLHGQNILCVLGHDFDMRPLVSEGPVLRTLLKSSVVVFGVAPGISWAFESVRLLVHKSVCEGTARATSNAHRRDVLEEFVAVCAFCYDETNELFRNHVEMKPRFVAPRDGDMWSSHLSLC